MSQSELLKHVVEVLEAAAIPYMLTGSTVSSLQGQPRATHDIDVVVGLQPANVTPLLAGFPPPRFYLEETAIREALQTGIMFNAIDSVGDAVDFWPLKSDPFDLSAFRRRYQESAAGTTLYVSRPEDTILHKLRWAKASGGSEKQMADCVAVYEVSYASLDLEYLADWSRELKVADLLERVRQMARM